MIMHTVCNRFSSSSLFILIALGLWAQTGPGGVGNTLGSTGQPSNVIWLDANSLTGIVANSNEFTTWADLSGNNVIFATSLNGSSTNAAYFANQLNGNAVVRFTTGDRLVVNSFNNFATSEISVIIVFNSSGSEDALMSYAVGSGPASNEFLLYDQNNMEMYVKNTPVVGGGSFNDGTFRIFTGLWENNVGTNGFIYRNGTQTSSNEVSSGNSMLNGGSLVIGGNQGDINNDFNLDQDFAGDIAEVIVFKSRVNDAQRWIIENYLSQKYNITITNDRFAPPLPQYRNLIGIGRQGGANHEIAASDGFSLGIYDGTFDVNDEFVVAAHCECANSTVTDSLGGGVQERWARNWYLDKTGTVNASITFDFSDGIPDGLFPQVAADYLLLRRAGSSYNTVTVVSKTISDDRITFEIANANLTDGYYTLGTANAAQSPVVGLLKKTWYSLKNGNWADPTVWTLDGSVAPLSVNPGNNIPSSLDRVVVTNGREVQMRTSDGSANLNNVTIEGIEVIGTLNVGTSYGHNFGEIKGRGTIQIEGSSLDDNDNFPSGINTEFAGSTGGLLEIRGDGMTLNTNRTLRNLNINLNSGIVTLLSNWTINNDFTVSNGTFRFGNTVSTTVRNMTVNGNVVVSSSGLIRTGTANARHQFNLNGDFTNNGSVQFTNRVAANFTADATDGIVDVNILDGTKDQSIFCNNVTRFYRIEIDKGADKTYVLNINSTDPANFLLFGRANIVPAVVAQLTTNDNALGLIRGTVRIGQNVTIVQLNSTDNYSISEGAKLWVDGGSVTKSAGTAIVPYGEILVTGGSLTASVNSGITTRGNGILDVQGGTVTMHQFRTSVFGSTNQGGYRQSGGTVFISSVGSNNDFYAMSLTYEGNTFSMTGGELTIRPNTRGGIFINGDESNFNVSGGTIIGEMHNANNFVITSRSAFFNLTIRKFAGGASQAIVAGGTSAFATAEPRTLAIQPLNILNDLVILNSPNNATFNSNGADISIQGDLQVQNGATFTPGSSPLIFYGSGNSGISLPTAATVTLSSLQINKNFSDQSLQILSGNVTAALQINGDLSMVSGKFDLGSFNVRAQTSVILTDTIGVEGNTGNLIMNGITSQTITSTIGAIYNLTIDNSNGVTLAGKSISIENILTLNNGNFSLGSGKLRIRNQISGSGFGSSKMIVTEGNSSDGGLEIFVNNIGTYSYPFGVIGKYTPVELEVLNYFDDGFVVIKPVNGILQTTNLAGGSDILGYYWRVDHSDFTDLPSVTYLFNYNDGDIGGTESNYVPGKVLEVNPFTRSFENDLNKVDDVSNTITFNGSGSGFALENASYTAGQTNRFTGSVRIFYVRSNGNWTQNSTWSFTRGGAQTGPGVVPVAGDIVVLRRLSVSYSGIVTVNATVAAAKVIFDSEVGFSSGCPRLTIQTGSPFSSDFGEIEIADSHQGGVLDGVNHGAVIQYNVDNSYAGVFPSGDFGGFNNYINALVIYAWQSGNGTVTLSSAANEYPMIWFEGGNVNRNIIFPNTDVVVRGRAVITGNFGSIRVNGGNFPAKLHFEKDLFIGSVCCGGGSFQFQGTATASQTVQVDGNLTFDSGAGGRNINILSPASGTFTHNLIVKGNISVLTGHTLNLGTGSALESNVTLTLQGAGTNTFTNSGTVTLYRIVMDKGSSISDSFSFNNTFTLTGTSNTALKAIELRNGLLRLNNASINVVLSNGTSSFFIPQTAGLEVAAGTASISGSDIGLKLDGLLRVAGGNINIDDAINNGNNFIEYGNTNTATIEVSSGSLTIGSQVRRSSNSSDGILKYRQTGGTVIIGRRSSPTVTRGIFEVINSGSEFTHTGGDFIIVRGINSLSVPSLLLEPSTANVSGSNIIIGNANTPAGTASDRIGIKGTISLNNLTVNNASANNPVIRLYSTPLTINGTLNIAANTSLLANGRTVTLNGDFVNNGTYTSDGNTTIFGSASGTQNFSGSGTSSFFNLTKSGAGTLNLVTGSSQNITVTNDLNVTSGTINQNEYSISVARNAQVSGTLSSSSGNGLVFNGTAVQQLAGTSNQNVNLGTITINNVNGVEVTDGQGFRFTITENLRMQTGLFKVGGSLLVIGKEAVITPVSSFSVNNMIQTNSSFTDNGVRKIFNGSESSFVFPVGELKYTPLSLNMTSIDEDATVTVRPANELHPTVSDDLATPSFNESLNALTYHWVVKSTGITAAVNGTATFTYDQSDIAVNGNNPDTGLPWTETNYVAARLTSGGFLWDKAFLSPVNSINNTLTVPLDQSSVFEGEYTAGIGNAFRAVPIFQSTGNVSFSNGENWQRSDDGGVTFPINLSIGDGAPVGASVIVSTGNTLTLNANNIRLLSTIIEDGAVVNVDPLVTGIRLGEVSGQGTLRLSGNVFPAGNYEDFLSCSGGGLDYTGTSDFTVMAGISQVRNLTLSGTGERSLAFNIINVCNDLVIDGPAVTKDNFTDVTVDGNFTLTTGSLTLETANANINVRGNVTLTGGTFAGFNNSPISFGGNLTRTSGTFTPNGSIVTFDGSTSQQVTGSFNMSNVVVNNTGAGLNLTAGGGGSINIAGVLTLTDGLVTTSTANMLTLTASGTYSGASINSYINGPIGKQNIAAIGNFEFPVGKGGRYAPVTISAVGTGGQNWTAEYFTSMGAFSSSSFDDEDPGSGFNALIRVQGTDRWQVESSGSNSAFVRLTYGAHNGFENSASARVVRWDATEMTPRWENQGGIVSGTNTSGTIISEVTNGFSSQQFGLGYAPETLLPVEWIYFISKLQESGIILEWATATETNNSHFEIEHSLNGLDFTYLGQIIGHGTTSDPKEYIFPHNSPKNGYNYYRLRQVDFDGMFEYSPIVYQIWSAESLIVNVYPNPVIDWLTIQINQQANGNYELYSIAGRLISNGDFENVNNLTIDVTALPIGIYTLRLRINEKIKLVKVIKK